MFPAHGVTLPQSRRALGSAIMHFAGSSRLTLVWQQTRSSCSSGESWFIYTKCGQRGVMRTHFSSSPASGLGRVLQGFCVEDAAHERKGFSMTKVLPYHCPLCYPLQEPPKDLCPPWLWGKPHHHLTRSLIWKWSPSPLLGFSTPPPPELSSRTDVFPRGSIPWPTHQTG